MTRTSVDLVNDVGLAGDDLTGKRDVTRRLVGGAASATGSADAQCAYYGVSTVTMPDNCKLLVSTQAAGGPTVLSPKHAKNWITQHGIGMGDIGQDNGCQIVLDMVTQSQWLGNPDGSPSNDGVVTIFSYNGFTNGVLDFRINGQAAMQMSASGPKGKQDDLDTKGNLWGFACHGIRADKCVNPEMHVSVINTRTINTAGHAVTGSYGKASAFAIETVGVKGGLYYVEFDTQDGSIGSECLVFHGVSAVDTPWIVKSLRSQRMFRGVGCYSGGQGEVHDLVVKNLYTQDDQKIPGFHKILAKAINIESGGSDSAPATPGPIKLYAPQSTNSPEFVTVNNNRGTANGRVELYGIDNTPGYSKVGFSKNDGNCINFSGSGPCTDGVYITDFHFDNPDTAIVNGTKVQGECVYMTGCTFSPTGATKAAGGASATDGMSSSGDKGGHAWGLTFGAGSGNSAPTLSNISPADGATVTAGASVTVSCDATDDGPFSGLSASGQVYLPAVATTSITNASGTTVTVSTGSNPHRATNGGKVRIKGATPAGLNGTWTVTSTADNFTLTYVVPSNVGTASVQGTVEPLGSTLTLVPNAAGTGFTTAPDHNWTAPSAINQTRRIEIIATDSGTPPLSSDPLVAGLITSTTNNPPLVAVVPPGLINAATGQTLSAIVIDPNAGDTISAANYIIKDSTNATVLSGTLTAATPAVDTTIATTIADVATLTGDDADTITLTNAPSANPNGDVFAAVHGTGIAVIAYAGFSGNTLLNCTTLAGTGALATGDKARSANYSATFDASSLTPGATYQAQATAKDQIPAQGSSLAVPFAINTPPTVVWAYPVAAQSVAGFVIVKVTATDDGDLTKLKGGLYNRDTGSSVFVGVLTPDTDGVLTYGLDTTTLTDNADHTFRARVVDSGGLVTTADVTFHVDQGTADTTPPEITDITFADGQTLAIPTDLAAAVTDPGSGVASVFVRIDLGGGRTLDIPMELQT